METGGAFLDRVDFSDYTADWVGEVVVGPHAHVLLDHFGPDVQLYNVKLEEALPVEIYRRGIHSEAFGNDRPRPRFAVDVPIDVLQASSSLP